MPEFPEIRAHAERLHEAFRGAELEAFTAASFTVLKTVAPPPDAAVGRTLTTVTSRGKLLFMCFDGPEGAAPEMPCHTGEPRTNASDQIGFVIHLMQAGRLRPEMGERQTKRSDRARWQFLDGRSLVLTEAGTERAAGIWMTCDPEVVEPVVHLGPDADTIDETMLRALLQVTSVRLHGFLRDQRRIAGLGRRLANEICHRARLSPFALTTKLSSEEIVRLENAITVQIATDLAVERARPDMSGSKQRPSNVHNRIGENCPVCGDTIRAVEYRAYTIVYCPTCQTAGKVLADNTTSKFLK